MEERFDRLSRRLSQPVLFRVRILLLLLTIPLAASFFAPLWRIHMVAPQYPAGLDLWIHTHTVSGDVQEVNTLNHYIGMHSIDRASLSDLDWIPFGIGALLLLMLRAAFIGDNRSLLDLIVMFTYFGIFSMARFGYRLWVFGHDLDPKAPFTVEPFMPVMFGSRTIANFETWSGPQAASFLIGAAGVGLIVAFVLSMRASREATV